MSSDLAAVVGEHEGLSAPSLDDVLAVDAQEFVRGFVQKGGQ